MKKLALVSISLATLVGIAAAQQPTPPAKTPAPPAKTPAPAADKKAPPAATPAAATAKPGEPVKPPQAPQELADFAKQIGGMWKCAGKVNMGGNMIDVKATLTHRVDATLNKFWIQTSLTGTAPKMPPTKATWFTTFDANAKKLWRVNVGSRGGHGTAWGTIADKKVSWEGDQRWPSGEDVKTRSTEELVSPKEVKVLSEASKDGGKTWDKEVEVACKK